MLDVRDHQGQGDHHIGLNVACPALCDELQIVLKCMRFCRSFVQLPHEHLESLDLPSNH